MFKIKFRFRFLSRTKGSGVRARERGKAPLSSAALRAAEHGREEKQMKKKFKMQDLDCANCAQKMEDAIKKIPGVTDASVNFMTQKMTVEADDEKFDDIMKEVQTVCSKVEPDCRILM